MVADYPVRGNSSYGLQPVYYNLSQVQAAAGHEVDVIARKHESQPGSESFGGVNVHRVGPPFTVNALRTILHLLKGGSKKVIHTHSTSGVFLSALRRVVKAPVVSHVHGTTYSSATPSVLHFGNITYGYSSWGVTASFLRERALWSTADRVAAVSSSVVSDLTAKYGVKAEKIRLVYNGVNPDIFRPVPAPEAGPLASLRDKKIVLYVGHFGLRKGVPILLEAMKMAAAEVKDSYLVCVGGIPPWLPRGEYMSYLERLVRECELKDRVLFLDRVRQEMLPAFYSAASVFVLPSYYEAFPKVLIEAMACERPVIATLPGGTIDSVKDGVNGFLVPYANVKVLAERVVTLLQDDGMARRMGSKGRERVLREFTWQAVAGRLDSVYQEVMPNQP